MINNVEEITDEFLISSIEYNYILRNSKLVKMIKLLNSIQKNQIISIDGEWGSGKTIFVKQLLFLHEHKDFAAQKVNAANEVIWDFSTNYYCFYYNAWENDDHKCPLESLSFYLLNEFSKLRKNISDWGNIHEKAEAVLYKFLETISGGLIAQDYFKSIHTFDDLDHNVRTFEEKKKAFNSLLDVIAKNKRLLLVVDELDRCRPSFAVKMLETLKHFFNNDKITILVVTNNKELSYTIKKYYGEEFDGYLYLNKIYHLIINLEAEKIENYLKYNLGMDKSIYTYSIALIHVFKLSYRECNTYKYMFDIVADYGYNSRLHEKNFPIESKFFLPLALILKIKDIDLYNQFIFGYGVEVLDHVFSKWEIKSDNPHIEETLELLKPKEQEMDYKVFIKMKYTEMFKSKNKKTFPWIDALSMIGSLALYE